MNDTPSPAPSSASQGSQASPASGANGEAMPEFPERWPTQPDKPQLYDVRLSMIYHVALAAAWEARARLAVEALDDTRKWLLIDEGFKRYDAQREVVEEALAAIGPLPSPKEQRA